MLVLLYIYIKDSKPFIIIIIIIIINMNYRMYGWSRIRKQCRVLIMVNKGSFRNLKSCDEYFN
jgi:hypothetical protein